MSKEKVYVIVGLGITGLSCARFLKEQQLNFAMLDTRENPPQLDTFKTLYPEAQIALGGFDEALLASADVIVLSPGVSLQEEAIQKQIQRGATITGDIELFAQYVRAPVISITGTNAKSTVTTLVGKMVEKAGFDVEVGGNLGVPALDLLLTNPKADAYVLELSSFQLETTSSLRSKVATVLNITPDHMDRYENFAAYQAAKHRVYQQCEIAICNRDDELTTCQNVNAQKYYFTLQKPREREFGLLQKNNENYLAFGEQILLSVSELPVKGKHYQANALASLAIGYSFGLPVEAMLAVLREFKGLPHRCQLVREHQGVQWYNDSKGTNVGATQAAIIGLGGDIAGKLILIAGGVGKNADFEPLLPALLQYTRHIVLIGEAAQEIAYVVGEKIPVSFATTMDEAIHQAAKAAQPKDCVLLSPACASFDMFNNYAHRGDVFTNLVQQLV